MAAQERGRRIVAAADFSARALGLKPGMALAEATALCPNLVIGEADAGGDGEALTRMAAWCFRRYSPLIAVDPPDGLILDITGCAHLFGGEANLIRDLGARLERHGVSSRIAVADTARAAWAVARYGEAGATIVPAGETAKALASLPAAALRLPAETASDLDRLGLRAIGDLMKTPRAPLSRRFGLVPLRRLDEALGQAREPLKAVLPADAPRQRFDFAEPITTAEVLGRAVQKLVKALCCDLDERGVGARRLDLILHRVDSLATALRVGTARPNRNAVKLMRLFRERLDAIDAGFGVEAIDLITSLTESLKAEQTEALGNGETADLAPFIDAVNNRSGQARVYRVAPVESDCPERSVKAIPPLAQSADPWPTHWARPARLLTPPEPISAVALLPDYAPRLFVWRRQRHEVRHADGPERINGEWWRGGAEAGEVRDYYQVEDHKGRRYWLFRRTQGEVMRWFIHGVFA